MVKTVELFTVLEYRQVPIPNMSGKRSTKAGYRNHPIDRASKFFGDSVIDLRDVGFLGENHYFKAKNPTVPGAIPELLVRSSVAKRLRQVRDCLRLHSLDIWVKDAFRPIKVQEFIYITIRKRLANENPGVSKERLDELVAERVAFAPDMRSAEISPSPHMTGGAIDLTLCNSQGEELQMGQDLKRVRNVMYPDALESTPDNSMANNSNLQKARANRRLLFWIMTDAGFVINPTEWWHFSWGDQMWARLSGEKAAHYSLLNLEGQ